MPTSSSASSPLEFTVASGIHVCIPEWRSVLDGINFSPDGVGGLLLLPLPGMEEQIVLFALPEKAGPVSRPEELWLDLAVVGRANTMSVALVIGYGRHDAVPKGPPGHGLFTLLDLGIPAIRSSIGKLAEQSSVLVLVVHPRTGELLFEVRHAHVELREGLRTALARSIGVRAMLRAQTLRAHADLSRRLSS